MCTYPSAQTLPCASTATCCANPQSQYHSPTVASSEVCSAVSRDIWGVWLIPAWPQGPTHPQHWEVIEVLTLASPMLAAAVSQH